MVHFLGNVETFEPLLNDSPVVCYHGMIDNKYTRYIMDNSDFILNIGNAVAYDLLPSKVFGSFATGKPIINVIGNPKDVTLPYFERYKHSIELLSFDREEHDSERLLNFIRENMSTTFVPDTGLFEDFIPSAMCDKVLS